MLMGSLELVIQVQERGFSIYCNTRFLNFFPHRRDVRKYSSLRLSIPAFDDNGTMISPYLYLTIVVVFHPISPILSFLNLLLPP